MTILYTTWTWLQIVMEFGSRGARTMRTALRPGKLQMVAWW